MRWTGPGEDVEHAGGNLDHGLWVQFVRRTGSTDHGKEESAGKSSVSTRLLKRADVYLRRGLMCYVNY